MKITATPTKHVTTYNGAPVRVWEAVTEKGVPFQLFVRSVRAVDGQDLSEFDEALNALGEPVEIELTKLPPPDPAKLN